MQLPISSDHYCKHGTVRRRWKPLLLRALDIAFCLLVSLLLLPIIVPLIVVFIIGDSGRPVLFIQQRVGYRKRVFNCLKFRTMTRRTKADGGTELVVTRVGAMLRNTGLDELPQLINVLKGDMSVVGPRPYSLPDDVRFSKSVPYYEERYKVRPGITGLAQTRGYKGWIQDEQEIRERTAIDLMYVSHHTFGGNLKIIGRSFIFFVAELVKPLWRR